MSGFINKIKDSIIGDTTEKNSNSSSFNTGNNTSGTSNITHGDDMGRGVGHEGTGIGTNTTSTPLFGDKDRDNHDGHTENSDLARYEQRHGHTHGLDVLEGQQGGTTGLGSSTTGTGLGSSTTGTGMGSTTGTGLGSNTGTSAHTSGSGVGYGQNTSRGLGNTSEYDQNTSTGLGNTSTGYDQNNSSGYGQNTSGTGTTGTSGAGGLLNKLNPFSSNENTGTTGTTGTTGSGMTGSNTTTGSGLTGSNTTGTSSTGGYESHYPGLHSHDVVSELKGEEVGQVGVQHRHNLYMSDKLEDYQQGSGRHTVGDPNYGMSHSGQNTGTGVGGMTGGQGGQGVGSGYGNTGNTGTTGYGGTQTAGPHNSNVANELDPRVDSDQDGSRLR